MAAGNRDDDALGIMALCTGTLFVYETRVV